MNVYIGTVPKEYVTQGNVSYMYFISYLLFNFLLLPPGLARKHTELDRYVKFITKILQFQPEVQQKFFSCRYFDYSVVVFFTAWQTSRNTTVETSELLLNFWLELKKLCTKFY